MHCTVKLLIESIVSLEYCLQYHIFRRTRTSEVFDTLYPKLTMGKDLFHSSLRSWRYCVLVEEDLAVEPLYQSSEPKL